MKVITEEIESIDDLQNDVIEHEPSIEQQLHEIYQRGFSEGFALGYQSAMEQAEQFDPQYD